MTDPRPMCALTIAGSDSGGGAGIQADLRTFAAHRVHGLSAITALTAQHTRGIIHIHIVPVESLRAQIDACFDDFRIGAVKLGMLPTAAVIHAVADAIEHYRPPAVVLDPVMVATSGARLLRDDALDALRSRLLPLASLLTPNAPEAAELLGRPVTTGRDAESALGLLHQAGARAILLKGGHLHEGDRVIDRFSDGAITEAFVHPRLPRVGHGTGCTLAAAVAAQLCGGLSPVDACRRASDYVSAALESGYRPGRGDVVVLDHGICRENECNKKAGD